MSFEARVLSTLDQLLQRIDRWAVLNVYVCECANIGSACATNNTETLESRTQA
jgi:hypothetical protein